MVCIGNICRSPLAHGILEHKAKEAGLDVEVDSAGTHGYHVGEPPHKSSIKIARMKGIDISHQRSRQFDAKGDFEHFDHIYALAEDILEELQEMAAARGGKAAVDAKAKLSLLMDEAFPGEGLSVADPYYGPESGYLKTFSDCELACDAIVKRLLKERDEESRYAGK